MYTPPDISPHPISLPVLKGVVLSEAGLRNTMNSNNNADASGSGSERSYTSDVWVDGIRFGSDGRAYESDEPPPNPRPRQHNDVVHLPDAEPNESAEPDIEIHGDPSYDADPDPDPDSSNDGHGHGNFPANQFHRDSESPSINGSVVIKHGKTGRPELDGMEDEDSDAAFEKRAWRKIGLSRSGWKGEKEVRSIRRGMGDIGYDEETGKMRNTGRPAETDLNPQNFASLLNHHLSTTSFLHLPTTPLFYPSTQVRSSASAAMVHRFHHQGGGEFGIRVLPRGLSRMEGELEERAGRVGGGERVDPVSMRSGRVGLGGQALEGSFAGLNFMEDHSFAGGGGGIGASDNIAGRPSRRRQTRGIGEEMNLMLGPGPPGGIGFGAEGFALALDRDIHMA